jgi:hypothetical protein
MLAPLLLTLAASAAAYEYDLPALPVRVAFSGGGQTCQSEALRGELAYRFLRVGDARESSELDIRCHESAALLVLDVYASGRGIGRFKVERSAGSDERTTAYLAAAAAAKDSEVIAAALDAYVARNASLAAAGADDLSAGTDWSLAAQHLAAALDSDLPAAPIYFGLYRAHAELGHPIKAKWYLEAFLRAAARRPSELTDAQARPLIKAQASGASDAADADSRFAEYSGLASRKQWHAALYQLREIVAQAPWYEPAYVSLAQSYDRIGWKRLAIIWRARAVFARKLNKDARLGKEIEARLDAAR